MRHTSTSRRLMCAVRAGSVTIVVAMAGSAVPAQGAGNDAAGDGMPNRWETAHGLNPRSAVDATRDPDHDGVDNEDEDDTRETCAHDDGDRDGDDVSDEDENDLGLRPGDSDGDGDEASAADLQPGVEVAEIEFVDDSNELDEVKIYLSTAAVRGRLSRQAG